MTEGQRRDVKTQQPKTNLAKCIHHKGKRQPKITTMDQPADGQGYTNNNNPL